MSYLIAVPGFKQEINGKLYTIIRMYSTQKAAETCIKEYKDKRIFRQVRLYLRKKEGKLFGRHPYCIAIMKEMI